MIWPYYMPLSLSIVLGLSIAMKAANYLERDVAASLVEATPILRGGDCL